MELDITLFDERFTSSDYYIKCNSRKGMGFREEKVSERQREVIKASKKLIEKEGDFSTATTVHLKHTSLSPL